MIKAENIRENQILNLGGTYYKVISSYLHSGTAKMGSMLHCKLRNLTTGHIEERRFATDEKIVDLPVERINMQFLYEDETGFVFMHPETYEQFSVQKQIIGKRAKFIVENMEIPVEFYEGRPIDIEFPKVVEIKVAQTGVGLRGSSESTFKEATLENGIKIMVPQFILPGDTIKVEVETNRYIDRIK